MFVCANKSQYVVCFAKKYPPNNRWETEPEKTDYVFLVQTYYKIRRKKSKQFSPCYKHTGEKLWQADVLTQGT